MGGATHLRPGHLSLEQEFFSISTPSQTFRLSVRLSLCKAFKVVGYMDADTCPTLEELPGEECWGGPRVGMQYSPKSMVLRFILSSVQIWHHCYVTLSESLHLSVLRFAHL